MWTLCCNNIAIWDFFWSIAIILKIKQIFAASKLLKSASKNSKNIKPAIISYSTVYCRCYFGCMYNIGTIVNTFKKNYVMI